MKAALRVPGEGTLSEQELTRLAQDVLPGGVLGKFWFPPGDGFIPASAEGAYMTSIAGDRYLDMSCGGGTLVLGHRHPAQMAAVEAQLSNGHHYFSVVTEQAIRLAAMIKNARSMCRSCAVRRDRFGGNLLRTPLGAGAYGAGQGAEIRGRLSRQSRYWGDQPVSDIGRAVPVSTAEFCWNSARDNRINPGRAIQ